VEDHFFDLAILKEQTEPAPSVPAFVAGDGEILCAFAADRVMRCRGRPEAEAADEDGGASEVWRWRRRGSYAFIHELSLRDAECCPDEECTASRSAGCRACPLEKFGSGGMPVSAVAELPSVHHAQSRGAACLRLRPGENGVGLYTSKAAACLRKTAALQFWRRKGVHPGATQIS